MNIKRYTAALIAFAIATINSICFVNAASLEDKFDAFLAGDSNSASNNSAASNFDAFLAGENKTTTNALSTDSFSTSDNKPLTNTLTNKNTTGYNTQVSYPNACCAYIDGQIVYYSFIYQPYVYAYNGTSTVEYNAGGAPSGIVVKDGKIYYLNEDNMNICTIDVNTKQRNIIFARLSTITKFVIVGNSLYAFGNDENDVFNLYKVDISSGNASVIMQGSGKVVNSSNTFTVKYLTAKNNLLYILSTKANYGDTSRTIEHKVSAVNTDTNSVTDVYTLSGSGEMEKIVGSKKLVTKNYPSSVSAFANDSNVYLQVKYMSRASGYDDSEETTEYYMCDINTNNTSKISQTVYESEQGKGDSFNGYRYAGSNSSITRTNTATGTSETLVASGSNEKYNYIACDGNKVVFWSGKISSTRVAKADQYSGAIYSGQSHLTEGYTEANIYVMNADGNNMQVMNSYNKQTGNTGSSQSSGGSFENTVPSSQTCVICHGFGSTTCSYCHGTGIAISASIGLGGHVSEGRCPSCGGSGKKTCTVCSGTGTIYN